ncbi:hypothetical protein GOBAR_AA07554 [Gossypium barbadense]|uniref:S-acyltransferase n=1 Tax=Gossypium barbadense TaxID=3634 RepID=A0A2P5YBW6_GOSBA|nr:hypothetical protein GOBAR_AA07554 [Gossypium barbadense]
MRIMQLYAGVVDCVSSFQLMHLFSSVVGVEPLQVKIFIVRSQMFKKSFIMYIHVVDSFAAAEFNCGGVWAVHWFVFSVSYTFGIFHYILTAILAATTVSTFSLSAFRCAGTPPTLLWGSYPVVGKGDLENYTFCHYCVKPKSPRAHHCRSCGTCVLDMDHHCPFIGNCVGAANHRHFIAFLFSAVFSTIYISFISAYAGLHIWPPVKYRSLGHLNGSGRDLAIQAFKEVMLALIGLSVLLWQQLCYIYEGKTYLSHLSSQGSGGDHIEEKGCQNIFR